MKYGLSLLFWVCALGIVMAQDVTPKVIGQINDNLMAQKNRGEKYYSLTGVEGSPYMQDSFVPATLYPDNKPYLVRYNAVDDEIEVQLAPGKVLALDNARRDYQVVLKDTALTYVTLHADGVPMPGFFISVWKKDNVALFKKQRKKFFEGRLATDNFSKNTPARFSHPEDIFYVRLEEGGPLVELPTKKNSFADLWGKDATEIKKFLSKNHIDLREETDVVKAVSFAMGERP